MIGTLRGEAEELAQVVKDFPATLDQAITDWVKFELGMEKGLFSSSEKSEILEWFGKFPDLWELVRPNFVMTRTDSGTMLPLPMYEGVAERADEFVAKLKPDLKVYQGLGGMGIAPIIVAGIILAGVLGIGGAIWAISYYKQQANISRIIDEVTAGRISEDVLRDAIQAEVPTPLDAVSGVVGGVQDILTWLAIGVAGYFLVPKVAEWFRSGKS